MAEEPERRHEALIQAGLVLASELSLPAVLQKFVELASVVADARYGALGVLGADGRIEQFVTHGVTEEERRAIGRLPVGKGILGVLIREARPLRLRRIQDDPRSVGFPANHPPMTSFLGVPIKVHGTVYGNLYLTEKRGAVEFTEDDERAVITLGAQAGVAIENARLYEESATTHRRLAILEDRERIAKELHDGAVQSLFAVGMSLQAAEMVADDPSAVRERIAGAVEDIDRVIRDLRNYIFGLRPGLLADRQLGRALEELVRSIAQPAGVASEVDIEAEAASLVAGRAADLIQAAREATSNAVRHSGSDLVVLSLRRAGEAAILEVADHGKGFDPRRPGRAGQGLENLRARAEALGGTLDIESAPGAGTRVRIAVPL